MNKKITLHPANKSFIFSGLASNYDITYDPLLKSYINEREYTDIMERLMDVLFMSYPCCTCVNLSYICCPFTLGLSLIPSGIQIHNAKNIFLEEIDDINKVYFNRKGINLSYTATCCSSYLVIDIINNK